MSKNPNRPIVYWLGILFLLNALYLLYELAFNSRLVDVAVSQLTDVEIHALELEGRFLSGVGLSLLLLRLIKIQGKSGKTLAVNVVAAVLIAFPLMFFGQKILVDQMVERTSAEQRLDAQYLILMKQGLANNALQLEGIQFDESDLDSAHTKTFLSVLGLMTFVSPDFVTSLKSESDRIIDQVAENEANRSLPESYENYRKLQESIRAGWSQDQKISDAYWTELATITGASNEAWNKLQQELLTEWNQLSSQQDEHDFTRSVLTLQRNLETYFEAREGCAISRVRDECLLKVEEVYTAEVTSQLGRYVAPSEWCHEPETVTVTFQRRGRFVTEQRQQQECRNLPYDHLATKLTVFSTKPTSYEEFIRSEEVSEQVVQRLSGDGLQLPVEWRANDRDTFIANYVSHARSELNNAVNETMEAELGSPLPLDLNARQFVKSDPIQHRLYEALQPLDPNLNITLGMDPITFRDLIIKPHYLAHADAERERLSGEAKQLANGERRAEEGKRYVRGLIVPPIAMGFSLFFALVNAVGLLASIPLLLGKKSLWLGIVIKVSGLFVIVTAPMIYHSNVVMTETYRYFQSEASKALTPIGSLFSTWVINTQPVIYNLANKSARIVPPIFPANQHEVEAERQSISQPGISVQPDVAEQANQTRIDNYQLEKSSSDPFPSGLFQIVSLDASRPLYEQVDSYITSNFKGVLIDVQQLADQSWVVHREPVITGIGTCLSNFQRAMQLSDIDSTQWRAARFGDCSDASLANNPVQIPSVTDFVRNFHRRAPDTQLWVHYQPSLLHEVNCHSVRTSANALAQQLGSDRFVATVSNNQTLSCFGAQEYNHAIAFLGPQYGSPSQDSNASERHLNLAEIQRLRGRTQGTGYRELALNLNANDLASIIRQLGENDYLLLQPQHFDNEAMTNLRRFNGAIGLYTDEPDKYEALIERYNLIIIRE